MPRGKTSKPPNESFAADSVYQSIKRMMFETSRSASNPPSDVSRPRRPRRGVRPKMRSNEDGRPILSLAVAGDHLRVVGRRPLQLEGLGRIGRKRRSTSALVVRMTGIALGWIGTTTALGSVVRKANRSFVASPYLILR